VPAQGYLSPPLFASAWLFSPAQTSTAMPEPDTQNVVKPDPEPGRPEIALLHDLTRWREQLARSIARNNLGVRSEQIATAVNRILLSLLFLCIAEDRRLIPVGTIREMQVSCCSGEVLPAFLRYTQMLYPEDPPSAEAVDDFCDLVIDERVLPAILAALTSVDRHYDLAIIPTEMLAEVMQQYLARTVRRSAAHQAIIVDTHDTTQSGGTTVPPAPAIGYLVKSSLAAARTRYQSHRIWAVWQPHTYSRTQTLFKDFTTAFKDADEVIVTEVYAAREAKQDYSSQQVVDAMKHPSAHFIAGLKDVSNYLISNLRPGDVLLVLSAGDADSVSAKVLTHLKEAENG